MNQQEIIKRLKEFNAYAAETISYTFKEKMIGSGWSLHFKKGEGITTRFRGPGQEAFSATCNKIRMFIQNNDRMSIYSLEAVYADPLIQDDERSEFQKVKNFRDEFLARNTSYQINNEKITNKRVLEVFLYGDVSHKTKDETITKTFEYWKEWPFFDGLKNDFASIIFEHLRFIDGLVYVNNLVLKRLNPPNNPPLQNKLLLSLNLKNK